MSDQRVATAASQAQEEAAGLKDRAAEAASTVTQRAGDEIGSLKEEATEQVRDLAIEARDRVGTEVDRAAHEAAIALANAGNELTTMASCAPDPGSPVAELVRQVGERVQSTAQRIDERGSQGIVDDVTRFARNRPGLFLMGAAGLGFAVGRLVRNTDTGSIVGAARSELTGGQQGAGQQGAGQQGDGRSYPVPTGDPYGAASAIDLTQEPLPGTPGPVTGPAAGMPGVQRGAF